MRMAFFNLPCMERAERNAFARSSSGNRRFVLQLTLLNLLNPFDARSFGPLVLLGLMLTL